MDNSETETGKARRWSGFVCPDCRFVFRVSRDHDGEGIVCPSCRRMLRLPKEGEETAPLMVPLQRVDFSDGEEEPRGERRTRFKRKRKKKTAEVPNWDPASGKWRMNNAGRKHALQTIAVWLAALTALLVAVYLFRKAGEPDRTRPAKVIEETPVQTENPVMIPLLPPEEDAAGQPQPPAEEK